MSQIIFERLGNICESITYGATAPADFNGSSGLKMLRITDITDAGVQWEKVPLCKISETDEVTSLLCDGDIVVARTGGTVGKSFLVRNPPRAVNASYLLRLRPDRSLVDPEYLHLFLGSSPYWTQLHEAARGAAQPNVNATTLSEISLPLPQLAEQQQIAARLKAQLAEVETARQAAQARCAEFAKIKQAILKEAFDQRGHAESVWGMNPPPVVALCDVADIAAGITLGRKTTETELIEVPYLRVANVQDGHLLTDDIKTIAASRREIEKLALHEGDLLLTEGGDLDKLGRGTCWRGQLALCIHQNHIFRVRLPNDRYDADFVSFQIGSPYGKAYFLAHAKKTTGIASINQRVLGAFPLISPSVDEQRRVAARLKAQLAEVETAEHSAETELEEIGVLPQRLLAQAFE